MDVAFANLEINEAEHLEHKDLLQPILVLKAAQVEVWFQQVSCHLENCSGDWVRVVPVFLQSYLLKRLCQAEGRGRQVF